MAAAAANRDTRAMSTPIAPRAPGRVYHGWIVLAALFTAGFFVYGGGLYCFGLFEVPLAAEFHWGEAETGAIFSAFWLTSPLLIVGGYAARRFGVTRLLAVGIVIEAICVLGIAHVASLPQLITLRAIMGFGKILFAVSIPITVGHWFKRNFATGLGIAWAGWHIGGMVLVPIAAAIIAHLGWRTACTALGVALLTLALGPILYAQRIRSPAQLGLGLDGDPVDTAPTTASAGESVAAEGTLGTLLKSPAFWLVTVATFFFYSTYGGLLAHQDSIVQKAGYSPATASLVLGSTAGFAAFGGLVSGWLLDRFSLVGVGASMHVLLLAGAVTLGIVDHVPSMVALVAYPVAFGITIGGSDIFFVALLRQRFAHVSVDFIYSAWYCMQLGTLFVSPIVTGRIYDLTGGYQTMLLALVASALVATVLSTLAVRGRLRAVPA